MPPLSYNNVQQPTCENLTKQYTCYQHEDRVDSVDYARFAYAYRSEETISIIKHLMYFHKQNKSRKRNVFVVVQSDAISCDNLKRDMEKIRKLLFHIKGAPCMCGASAKKVNPFDISDCCLFVTDYTCSNTVKPILIRPHADQPY